MHTSPSSSSILSVLITLPIPSFFFFNATAPTEIYTLSLHDALPIYLEVVEAANGDRALQMVASAHPEGAVAVRSEEHTSELQSRFDLVCRLLLEKKKKNTMEVITEVLQMLRRWAVSVSAYVGVGVLI